MGNHWGARPKPGETMRVIMVEIGANPKSDRVGIMRVDYTIDGQREYISAGFLMGHDESIVDQANTIWRYLFLPEYEFTGQRSSAEPEIIHAGIRSSAAMAEILADGERHAIAYRARHPREVTDGVP